MVPKKLCKQTKKMILLCLSFTEGLKRPRVYRKYTYKQPPQ